VIIKLLLKLDIGNLKGGIVLPIGLDFNKLWQMTGGGFDSLHDLINVV